MGSLDPTNREQQLRREADRLKALAIAGISISVAAAFFCILMVPFIYRHIQQIHSSLQHEVEFCILRTGNLWNQVGKPGEQIRRKRHLVNNNQYQGYAASYGGYQSMPIRPMPQPMPMRPIYQPYMPYGPPPVNRPAPPYFSRPEMPRTTPRAPAYEETPPHPTYPRQQTTQPPYVYDTTRKAKVPSTNQPAYETTFTHTHTESGSREKPYTSYETFEPRDRDMEEMKYESRETYPSENVKYTTTPRIEQNQMQCGCGIGPPGKAGTNGRDGRDGHDGQAGENGLPGKDATSPTRRQPMMEFCFVCEPGEPGSEGDIGQKGQKGPPGKI
ncbi:hypothetical protein WR25_09200 isoform L [Diploscapter pachys]|uniref:Nematode cuticle collagen N-terminal domain-containing protein n=1 Tax=Diploscapter pachys TaxID=2018661 RepID=A0A2A2LYR9_9BILA|nr:hypothetical protein WR25_09200 isoform L [Diploscapter pachys]